MVKVGGRYGKHAAWTPPIVSTNKKLWTCREKTRIEIVTNRNGGRA